MVKNSWSASNIIFKTPGERPQRNRKNGTVRLTGRVQQMALKISNKSYKSWFIILSKAVNVVPELDAEMTGIT